MGGGYIGSGRSLCWDIVLSISFICLIYQVFALLSSVPTRLTISYYHPSSTQVVYASALPSSARDNLRPPHPRRPHLLGSQTHRRDPQGPASIVCFPRRPFLAATSVRGQVSYSETCLEFALLPGAQTRASRCCRRAHRQPERLLANETRA